MKRAGKSSVHADFRLFVFLMTDLLRGLCKGFSGAFCRQGVVRRVVVFYCEIFIVFCKRVFIRVIDNWSLLCYNDNTQSEIAHIL